MRHTLHAALGCLLMAGPAWATAREPKRVGADEAQSWARHVVPLPKQMEIVSRLTLAADQVAIVTRTPASPVVDQAVKEVRESLGQGGRDAPAGKAGFTITLQQGGEGSADLEAVRNSGQAYRILPEEGRAGLRLIALTPRGLCYAGKTLQQLIKARATARGVEMPILRVTDWPDLEDRGLWGSDCHEHLRWLADRKMNIVEQISAIGVDDQGRGWAKLKEGREPMIELGPALGIKPVPVILHLEQVWQKGVFKAYPELRAQGGQEGAICYSKPAVVGVLAEWIAASRSLPGVEEVDVWMTENLHGQGGCRCPDCAKHDRSVLEARAIVAGWQKASEKAGRVGLRILTSEETEKSNPLFFRDLPADVKIWYYHSLLTYTAGETPMLRSYLAEFAGQGRWVGVCPSLTAAVNFTEPFTGPHFIHYRMNEFVDKRMSGLIGYATPGVHYAAFNVEAAAEWSWNAKGRSPREFALAWAVRRGIRDPEKFAEWCDVIGPVAWDVYGSDWPVGEQRNTPGKVAERLRKGTLPELGFVLWGVYRSPWGDIKSPQHLDADVAQARRAVELAQELALPEVLQESLVVQGYVDALKALWELKRIVTSAGVAEPNRAAAGRYFRMYVDGLGQAAKALQEWESTLMTRPAVGHATDKPVKVIEEAIGGMGKLAAELGVDLSRRR